VRVWCAESKVKLSVLRSTAKSAKWICVCGQKLFLDYRNKPQLCYKKKYRFTFERRVNYSGENCKNHNFEESRLNMH
jgi:hypothetical protein